MENLSIESQIELFKTAFESSYDGIHILDKDGTTLYINKACTRIEGITEDEAKHKNIRQLVEEGVYSESVTLIVLETNAPATIIQTAKNGSEILVTGTPIYKDGEIDKIIVNSRDITELNALKKEVQLREEQSRKYEEELELYRREYMQPPLMISKNPGMQKLLKLASAVSDVDSTVLLTGESGVGKGLISRYIHSCSNRSKGPFIKIDCGTIPETLFESEIFGYEKGAFTGAEKTGKIGLLELANGGTVFLDEIGEMPLSMQPKILRAIQDRQIRRVGGEDLRNLDVRIIAATNIDIEKMVEEKLFREDLYYRLNVVPIHIPPLRERPEDILPLVNGMMETINKKYGWNKKIDVAVIKRMILYPWPGNVRELENLIERLMVSTEETTVTLEDLPVEMLQTQWQGHEEGLDYKEVMARFEYDLIKNVVKRKGSIVEAAKEIGVDVTTIRRKLKRHEEILQRNDA